MPELPEVETVRRGLASLLPGRIVAATKTYDSPKSFPNNPSDVKAFLIGSSVREVRRRAKVLMIDFDSAYSLVIHLKMTGQLVFVKQSRQVAASHGQLNLRFGAGHPNESLIGNLPDRSTRASLEFQDGSWLFFNDQRKFGWMKLMPTIEISQIDFMKKVGPEPLEDSFTAQQFSDRMRRRNKTTIKAALLDQTVLAGVGNIYADESLWGANIHPSTRVRDVSESDLSLLLDELKTVLLLSIEKGGSTDRNYVNAEGKKGSYIEFARVFRREGQPCRRHPENLIEKIRVAGRGTHVCRLCQPPPQ